MELPVVPIGRIIKNSGAQSVSEDASIVLARYLEEEGTRIASNATRLSKHSGVKTISGRDMTIVINHLVNSPNSNISNNIEIEITTFKELYDEIDRKEGGNAEEIKEKVRIIEEELDKEEINRPKINGLIVWMRMNVPWITDILRLLVSISMGF